MRNAITYGSSISHLFSALPLSWRLLSMFLVPQSHATLSLEHTVTRIDAVIFQYLACASTRKLVAGSVPTTPEYSMPITCFQTSSFNLRYVATISPKIFAHLKLSRVYEAAIRGSVAFYCLPLPDRIIPKLGSSGSSPEDHACHVIY
jgi:hypothetical protein